VISSTLDTVSARAANDLQSILQSDGEARRAASARILANAA